MEAVNDSSPGNTVGGGSPVGGNDAFGGFARPGEFKRSAYTIELLVRN